jgi:leucine-rich repeat protein SHOC2
LKSLEVLDLSYNNIDELPEDIEKLENLRTLNLKGNKLKSVPKSILKIKKLNYINLDDNFLTEKSKKNLSGHFKSKKVRSVIETINAIDVILENS